MYTFFSFLCLLLLHYSTLGLIITHDFQDGISPYSYQTFSGIPMYYAQDAPVSTSPGNGNSYIHFQLNVHREEITTESSLELIVIPDTNIDDIGIVYQNELHVCCTQQLVDSGKCDKEDLDRLILKKDITGLYRYEIIFDKGDKDSSIVVTDEIQVTAIHIFAMASCRSGLGLVRFEGKSVWMNPYGHLPGDMYGYLPFFGWMTFIYLVVGMIWFLFNAMFWKELLYVQNYISAVLLLCLVEMITWYCDYLRLNNEGIRNQGAFVFGLILSVSRRTVSQMLVVAVSKGYGVVKLTLGSIRNPLIALGCVYWVFGFMFEALVHYNQTEKVETWMRAVLIPPVAILNGIFWWWTFVSLNRTIEMLKIRKQSAKLTLYKSFALVLVAALIAAIAFAIYEIYYVLKQLYFAEWDRLWFMEVGFWQILFSIIFFAMMILWRPSRHNKDIAGSSQLTMRDDDDDDDNEDSDDDEEDMEFGKPDTMNDEDEDEDNNNNNNKKTTEPMFTIGDEENADTIHEVQTKSDAKPNQNDKKETPGKSLLTEQKRD